MHEKFLIVLIGQQLSGKDHLAGAITKWCGPQQVHVHSTGDLVRSMLKILRKSEERGACSKLVETLQQAYGTAVLANVIRKGIIESEKPVQIFNSARLLEDEQMVQSLGIPLMPVYVTAPAEDRYQRALKRQRAGEQTLTREQFDAFDNLPTEQLIRTLGERKGNIHIHKSGTPEQLDQIELAFCQEHLFYYRKRL